jgi:hypothetical protein
MLRLILTLIGPSDSNRLLVRDLKRIEIDGNTEPQLHLWPSSSLKLVYEYRAQVWESWYKSYSQDWLDLYCEYMKI